MAPPSLLINKSKMSSASQINIDRFNKYKSLCEKAGSMCVRTFLHIVRPTEGFPYHSNDEIYRAWLEWKDAEEVFYRMTGSGSGWQAAPNRVFPAPPPEDAEHLPCRQMWGCLVQEQVERQDFQAPSIKEAVAAILASEACKSHPATCPCKVPNNPWSWHECVTELEPLGLKHNPKCQCGGWQRCKQNMPNMVASAEALAQAQAQALAQAQAQGLARAQALAETALAENPQLKVDLAPCRCDAQYSAASCSCLSGRVAEAKSWAKARESAKMAAAAKAASERATAEARAAGCSLEPTLPRQSSYDYHHHIESCPCGTCHKARVDSGTQEAYEKKCKEATRLALDRLDLSPASSVLPVTGGFGVALSKACSAIATAEAQSGGIDQPDFAKNLFAAMGTPHDSKCPHGLPFYACMPCSH